MRGCLPAAAFGGFTLEDRHPNEPSAIYTDEELSKLCPVCGTLVVHRETHEAGQLHQERKQARDAKLSEEPTPLDVVAALRVLQGTRPEVLATSLATATCPSLFCTTPSQKANSPSNIGPAPPHGPAFINGFAHEGGAPPGGSLPQRFVPT